MKTVEYPEAQTEIFTYDNAGNRTRRELAQEITTYEYDTRNRLTSTANNGIITTYNYDNNGNLLKETKGSEITSYTYDNFNRPVEVVLPNESYQMNHYDAMGLRVGLTENGWGNDENDPSTLMDRIIWSADGLINGEDPKEESLRTKTFNDVLNEFLDIEYDPNLDYGTTH